MKRFWLSLLAIMLVTAFTAPAFAWEFSMTGEYEYRLRYFSRTGSQDLFGNAAVQEVIPGGGAYGGVISYDQDLAVITPAGATNPAAWGSASAPSRYVGFAGPNVYLTGYWRHRDTTGATDSPVFGDTAAAARVAVTRGGFSRYGSDALYNDQRLTFNPSIRVNNAIRVHGVYTVGGFRHKYAQNATDAQGRFSPGTPPYERYYTSQTSDAAYNTAAIGSWEQVRATIQTPYGIFSIGAKDFPLGVGATLANNTRTESFLTVVPYGPFRIMHALWLARGAKDNLTSWNTVPDKDSKADIFQGLITTYNNGPVELGAGWIYQFNHALAGYGTVVPGVGTFGYDRNDSQFLVYGKFFNGRFFTNLEYFWSTIDTHHLGFRPTFAEGYHWYSDAGVVCGPAKITTMFSIASGPVLNTGNVTKVYAPLAINYQALEPFSYLMFPIYGGGNNSFNQDGNGQMADAYSLAARLDYAVAANLNLFGSIIYAKRLEKNSTYAGQYFTSNNIDGSAAPAIPWSNTGAAAVDVARAQTWKALNGGGAPALMNPYVDDDFVGWEARGGLSWKLLEAFTMNAAYSYWQPGAWFDQAYRAFTAAPAGLLGDGLMVGRSAIHSFNGSMVIDF